MVRLALRLLLTLLAAGPAAPALAQTPSTSPGTIYRVFLNDGQALPSYGEAARVDDRVVFNLLVHRTAADQQLQLVSLPAAAVDMPRTARYAEAMRASFYAATRGEADYTAMTGEVAATLDQIARTTEVAARLQLAERARQRLLTWSREHYGYREGDVRELIDLFDALLTELRTGTGQAAFAFDLVTGAGTAAREPLLPAPTARESITLALAAARAADIPEERLAILQGAGRAAAAASAGDLAARVAAELRAEASATAAYGALAADVTARADRALQAGDVVAVERLRAELVERDRRLGSRRPAEVAELLRALQAKLEAARAHRLALDHYAYVRASLLAYERRIRPALSGLDGLKPVLEHLRDGRSMAFERIETARGRLDRFEQDAGAITAPEDLAGVHATLVSAVRMAREAVLRRRLAVVVRNLQADREASAAAAGALLLIDRARADLVEGLYPPKPVAVVVAAPAAGPE
jgi:hypothetical protein